MAQKGSHSPGASGKEKQGSDKKKIGIIAGVIAAVLVIGGVGGYFWYRSQRTERMNKMLSVDTIYEGVYVDEISLGGKTREEALAAIEEAQKAQMDAIVIPLSQGEKQAELTGKDLTYTTDNDAIVEEAMKVGREGDKETRYAYLTQTLPNNPVKLTTTLNIEEESIRAAIDKVAPSLAVEAVNATVENFDPTKPESERFTYVEGTPGTAVDVEKLLPLIQEQLSSKTYSAIAVPTTEVQPEITKEQLRQSIVKIGSCTTTMTNDSNRIHNIKLACAAISGTVLQPGETFSYNGVVGERTAARGYKEAGVIVNGQSDVGLGGGVCQVSSTLYNATVRADMEIVERRRHSYALSYLGPGEDATVDYGNIDFKFKNTSDMPVYLHMYTDGLKVIAEVYGKPLENGMTADLVIENLRSLSPGAQQVIKDSSIPVGSPQVSKARTGYKLDAYRVYYDANGKEVKREKLYSDHDPAIASIKRVNPQDLLPSPTPTQTPTQAPPTQAPTQTPTDPPVDVPTEPTQPAA